MKKWLPPVTCFVLGIFCACQRPTALPDDPAVWKKIKLDFRKIDAEGLTGPPDGKVAVHYEFCIPAVEKNWRAVQKIDPNAVLMKGSAGRVGCTPDRWLVVGNTHQPRYQRVLYELASLPFVEKIQQTFFE